ncbi:sulfonate ABC transporter substrate-binding protein [Methylococcus sp. EFPC2]|uniref:sulfonate ABC transporter substrate-binding protein n=1 Tax=Methylococcus sp. EFPC2 TaxID=2812648 RepID=UPI001967F9E7|nr:sulfonate ABC transporter substrate-binding protein [Methylococcus sp. EFPC2]QSA96121.1 sulfonate ABC transporter substrate-binding protein [Methylococcus sp. EFPC2]
MNHTFDLGDGIRGRSRLPAIYVAALLGLLLAPVCRAQAADGLPARPAEVRIGYQKYGTLILVKARGQLEQRLKALNVAVRWAEFSFGPPMLEALNAGHLDIAATGETPPVFALAARGSKLAYVGYEEPSPEGEAVLVRKDSDISRLEDLKGRKVAVSRGSNAHYLLIKALESAHLGWKDIQPVYLLPAEARAAFATGAVDAWAVWDFHLAAAQESLPARVLADGKGLVANHEIYTSSRDFADRYPELTRILLDEIGDVDTWVHGHPDEAAELLDRQLNVGKPALKRALSRRGYGLHPADAALASAQQAVADTLHGQGLLPRPIRVADAAPHGDGAK